MFQSKNEKELRSLGSRDAQNDDEDEAQIEQRRRVLDLLRKWQLGNQDESPASVEALMAHIADDDDDDEDTEEDTHGYLGEEELSATRGAKMLPHQLPSDPTELLALLSEEQRRVFLDATSKSDHKGSRERASNLWARILSDEQMRTVTPKHRPPATSEETIERSEAVNAGCASTHGNLWWTSSTATSPVKSRSEPFCSMVTALRSKIEVQQKVVQSPTAQPALGIAWNCLAVLVAYTYCLLHLDIPSFSSRDSTDLPDEVAVALLEQLVPFLFADSSSGRDASLLLDSPSSVTSYILLQLGEERRTEQPTKLILELYSNSSKLFDDVSKATRIAVVADTGTDSQGSTYIQSALEDIWAVLQAQLRSATLSSRRRRLEMASRKLVFYAAKMMEFAQTGGLVQHVLGTVNPMPEDSSSHLANLSKITGSSSAKPSIKILRNRLETTTIHDEMRILSSEIEALEDHERYRAAFKLECQRMGLDDGIQPQVGQDELANQKVLVTALEESDVGKETMSNPMQTPTVDQSSLVSQSPASTATSPVEPPKKSFASQRRARQDRERQQQARITDLRRPAQES